MRKILVLAAGVAVAASLGMAAAAAASPAAIRATAGASRVLPPGFYGINYDYGGASVYVGDSGVAGQLAALAPGTLRWPGGAGANYFQWDKGYPVQAGGVPGHGSCAPPKETETDGFRFTLADLAAAARRSGATPIFDLNVMTASLDSQIAMLRAARDRYRLPVRYVELGNEFSLCITDYVTAFPTAQDYGRTVAADVQALHRAFPGVKVAAVGATGTSGRAAGWNAAVLSEARPDAMILHDHPKFDQSLTSAGLPALFGIPYQSADTVASATRDFPGIPAWITEYGLSLHWTKGNAPQLTYANALFEDEAAILLAAKVSDATLVNYWAAFGQAVNYAYTPAGLTPVGLAMQWLDQAARGARSFAPVVFGTGPTVGSGDSALVGAVFSGPWSRHVLLVNLSGQSVTIAAGGAVTRGSGYRQVSGDPVRQIRTVSGLRILSGTVGESLILRPYSITAIG